MKAMKRRLLSLFMAMVMVLSLAPMALAENHTETHKYKYEPLSTVGKHKKSCEESGCTFTPVEENCSPDSSFTSKGEDGHATTCTLCGGELAVAPHDLEYTDNKDGTHSASCKTTGCSYKIENQQHSYNSNTHECVCGAKETSSDVPTTGISLNASEKTIAVGGTVVLQATIEPSNATNKEVAWESSDESIAKVNNGTVTGVAQGEATITAKQGSLKATCKITVTQAAATITVAPAQSNLKPGGSTTLTVSPSTGATIKSVSWSASPSGKVSFTSNTTMTSTNTVTVADDAATGDVTITAEATFTDDTKAKNTCKLTVTSPFKIESSPANATLKSPDGEVYFTAYWDDGTKVKREDVAWTIVSGNDSNSFVGDELADGRFCVTADIAGKGKHATVRATVTNASTEYVQTATVYMEISTDVTLTATVSTDYYLGEVGDKETYSVDEQLRRYVSNTISSSSNKRYLDRIRFTSSTETTYGELDVDKNYWIDEDEIEDILFTPQKNGKAVFDFEFETVDSQDKNSRSHSGTLTITVTDASSSSGDVTFYGEVGEDVSFDSATFEDFWDDKFPGGDLDYVTFSVSGGTLRDADNKTVGSKSCYVSPRKTNIGLDEVYFEPSSTNSKKATTVTFSFTAYGEDKKGNDKEASGRVSIVYMSDSPKDISYTVGANGAVSLKASDFTAAYKEVISGTVPSNLTIVFQGAPKNGTLTYNDSSKKNAKDVTLTNSSIKKYSFTTKSSGSNQLNDITYSGTSGTDTIEYTAYSGSTPKFKGNVVFNGKAAVPTDVSLYYASTAGQPARFSQNDFATANSVLSKAVKYRFAAPSNGTLYLNGTTSAVGIDVASSLLSSVTYQPKAGYNGSDKVVFMAYDASNALVASGTVNITIAGNPSTTNPSTPGSSGGVTDVSQFTDVSSTAWYRSNLATLVQKGVITGRGNGKFDPRGTVTYGEALKMVLQACGYTATVGTGSQWAINYKNLAVSRGWISNDIDLNAAISRNATAELAAKVLGVSPVTSGSPFADEANAYAVALYYTTPQVFMGSTNPNGGKPLFQNSSPLLREQVCAVICRVMDYHTQHTTNTMPDGT